MGFQRESAIVTYRGRIISASIGAPGSVDFDVEAVLDFMRSMKKRGKFLLNNLAFLHVHPPGFKGLSETDVRLMKSLNIAFGGYVMFGVMCFDDDALMSECHVTNWFQYFPPRNQFDECLARVQEVVSPTGNQVSRTLKIMSYAFEEKMAF